MPEKTKPTAAKTQESLTTVSARNVYERLLEVKRQVEFLKKDNSGAQFKFVSSSQTLLSVREKMNEQNLLLIPSITEKKYSILKTTDSGAVTIMTELGITYTWLCVDNPEDKLEVQWYGQGVDLSGEKGVGKALTYAEKYFMLKFFNIATDKDDPDAHQQAPGGYQNNHAAPGATQTPGSTVATNSKPKTASEKQVGMINALITKVGVDREKYKKVLGVESMNDLSSVRASKVIEALMEKQRQLEINGAPELPTITHDEPEEAGEEASEVDDSIMDGILQD